MTKLTKVIILSIFVFNCVNNSLLSPANKSQTENEIVTKSPDISESKNFPVVMMEVPLKVEANNPLIKDLLEKGTEKYKKYYEKSYEPFITNVRSIKHLIRAKSEFIFHVTFGASNCTKGIRENCVLLQNGDSEECIIDAYSFFSYTQDYRVFTYCTPDLLKEFPKTPRETKVQPFIYSPFISKWSETKIENFN